jgi:hypothetical protein
MGLRVRKALRLVFNVRGDQKTSEETSSENDVEVTEEIEKGLNLGRSMRNSHLDVLLQKGARCSLQTDHSLSLDTKMLQIIVNLKNRSLDISYLCIIGNERSLSNSGRGSRSICK